jgi:5-formyltetrahydrofolate cyclo-ligase
MALKPAESPSPAEIRKKLKAVVSGMVSGVLAREQGELVVRAESLLKGLESKSWFSKLRTVSLYAAAPGEVDVRFLERYFGDRGVRVVYPRVKLDAESAFGGTLEFRESSAAELKPGAFGIFEPASSQPAVLVREIDLAVFPGRAFGKKGERLGSGKGYYDRAFSQNREIPRVSFAFEYQIFERLPQFEWDLSLDWMVSLVHEYRSERI